MAHLHNPGDGWHHLPNGESSEEAVLSHVEDICKATGLDYRTVYKEAYPDEDIIAPSQGDATMCARKATLADLPKVLEDLEDINYHSLMSVLADKTGMEWGAGKWVEVDPKPTSFTPYEFEQLSIEEAARDYPHLWATIEKTLHLTQSNIALMVSIVVSTCSNCHNAAKGCNCLAGDLEEYQRHERA